MTIYLAGSSQDKRFVSDVELDLARDGINVLAPWLRWNKSTHPDECQNWHVLEACIQKSSAMVFVAPSEGLVSAGATYEAGYARGIGKPVYLYIPSSRAASDSFYHWAFANGVYRVQGWSNLLEKLAWIKGLD